MNSLIIRRTDAENKQEELRLMVGCVHVFLCQEETEVSMKAQGTVSRFIASVDVHNVHRTILSEGLGRVA